MRRPSCCKALDDGAGIAAVAVAAYYVISDKGQEERTMTEGRP